MGSILTFVHVINCLLLIVAVLLQSSKGGGLAGAFGGGGTTQAVFGGRGAGTFLSKATTVLAVVFMLTSLVLTVLGKRGGEQESALQSALEQEGRAAVPTAGLPQPVAPLEAPAEDAAAPAVPAGEGE